MIYVGSNIYSGSPSSEVGRRKKVEKLCVVRVSEKLTESYLNFSLCSFQRVSEREMQGRKNISSEKVEYEKKKRKKTAS